MYEEVGGREKSHSHTNRMETNGDSVGRDGLKDDVCSLPAVKLAFENCSPNMCACKAQLDGLRRLMQSVTSGGTSFIPLKDSWNPRARKVQVECKKTWKKNTVRT